MDKVLARADWCSAIPGACVTNILTRTFDHLALFLGAREGRKRHGGARRSFKFEMAWLFDEGCRSQVEEAWHVAYWFVCNIVVKGYFVGVVTISISLVRRLRSCKQLNCT